LDGRDVSFLNFGTPEKVALELLLSGNEWRIAEVEWDCCTCGALTAVKG
jgi:hypothetical protein